MQRHRPPLGRFGNRSQTPRPAHDTPVIWGGEFGRTVYSQGKLGDPASGRDHHGRCFTIWMAGGGVKPGFEYGSTDDYGWNIQTGGVHIRDLNATILHLLGFDHETRWRGRHVGTKARSSRGAEHAFPLAAAVICLSKSGRAVRRSFE